MARQPNDSPKAARAAALRHLVAGSGLPGVTDEPPDKALAHPRREGRETIPTKACPLFYAYSKSRLTAECCAREVYFFFMQRPKVKRLCAIGAGADLHSARQRRTRACPPGEPPMGGGRGGTQRACLAGSAAAGGRRTTSRPTAAPFGVRLRTLRGHLNIARIMRAAAASLARARLA